MRIEAWIAALALLGIAALPGTAGADSMDDEDVSDQLQIMQQRLLRMEDQLRDTNRRLQDAQGQLRAADVTAGHSSKLAAFIESIEFGGWVSASYLYNTRDPDGRDLGGFNSGGVPAYPFMGDSNSFSLDQVWLEIERPVDEGNKAGFRLDFVYGKHAGLLSGDFGAGDGFSGNDFELYQGYVQYLAPIGPGIHIKFGKFATVIGAEVVQAPANYNITRGHVYNLFQPITHTGILASAEAWEGGSFSFGVVNETRSFPAADIDLNKNKAILWSIAHDFGGGLSASFNGAHGSSDSGQGVDTRAGDKETILDFILGWAPEDSNFEGYINADYLQSENSITGSDDTDGFGIAAAGRYAVTPDLGLALRVEYVDLEVNSSPDELKIWGLTGTVDYALTSNLKVRGELRFDKLDGDLDQLFFRSGSSTRGVPGSGQTLAKDDQVVAGVEVIYSF